jgi:hypothetical protein
MLPLFFIPKFCVNFVKELFSFKFGIFFGNDQFQMQELLKSSRSAMLHSPLKNSTIEKGKCFLFIDLNTYYSLRV